MQYSIEVNNQVEIYDINKVAKQTSGAVLLRVKNTVVLATVAREDTQVRIVLPMAHTIGPCGRTRTRCLILQQVQLIF